MLSVLSISRKNSTFLWIVCQLVWEKQVQIFSNAICTRILGKFPGPLPTPAATIFRRGCLVVEFLSSTMFPRLLCSKDTIIKTMKSANSSDLNFQVDFQHFLHRILSVCEDLSNPRRPTKAVLENEEESWPLLHRTSWLRMTLSFAFCALLFSLE